MQWNNSNNKIRIRKAQPGEGDGNRQAKATTITMENNQKQITDEENDFVICFESGRVGGKEE